MDGLEVMSHMIQRYSIVEGIHSGTAGHPMGDGKQEEQNRILEDAITRLYSRILVYQASALRYLAHHKFLKVLSDTFKPEQWKNLIDDITKQDVECEKLLTTQGQNYLREKFQEQMFNIERLRGDLMSSFMQQLD